MNVTEIVYEKILKANELQLVLVLSQECYNDESVMKDELLTMIEDNELNVSVNIICFSDIAMPWPRPMTEVLYYFEPKNIKPLFLREGRDAVTGLLDDIELAYRMIDGESYEEATFAPNDYNLIKEMEDTFTSEAKQEYPTAINMMRNVGKELWKSAKSAGTGLPILTSKQVAAERYTLCMECPHFTKEARCTECGCFMKAKVNLAASECPIGKWDSV